MSRHGYSRKSNASIFKGTLHSSHFVLSSQFDKWSQQGKEHCWALPTAFWLLQSSDCRIWFEKLPKKSKKKKPKKEGPSSKLVQRIGPETTLLQSLPFYLCFIRLGKHVRAAVCCAPTPTQKPHVPVLQAAYWQPGSAKESCGSAWRGVFQIWRPLRHSRWDQHGMRKLT